MVKLKIAFLAVCLVILSEATLAIELKDDYAVTTVRAFDDLNKDTINNLDNYYEADAHFRDPITDVQGLAEIKKYYSHVYANVKSIHFNFQSISREGAIQTAVWKMSVIHPALNGGKELTLDGVSILEFNLNSHKLIAHRDYYDLGEFIYERIPILGPVIRYIKNKMKP